MHGQTHGVATFINGPGNAEVLIAGIGVVGEVALGCGR
jgi:hypothetical protein